MGGDGSKFALFGEKILRFCGFHRLGCEGSVGNRLAGELGRRSHIQ